MAAEDNCSKRHSLATRMAAWILLTIHLAACGTTATPGNTQGSPASAL